MKQEIENSVKYLEKRMGKTSGFTAPESYFEDLEKDILSNLTVEKFSNKKGFETPKGYLDSVEDSILKKIDQNKVTEVISLKNRIIKLIPYVAAACIVLFIGLNTFHFNSNTEITLNNNDIEFWLENNALNYNDIALVLEDDILDENDFSLANIKDEIIEEYLNNIDGTAILNETY